MKQIALMGLMAVVLAVGICSCSGGTDTAGDGGKGGDAGLCDPDLYCVQVDENGCCGDSFGRVAECMTTDVTCPAGRVLRHMKDCTCSPKMDGGDPRPDAGAGADAGCVPICAGRCVITDGCGGVCPDDCVAPQTCGGGGAYGVCGCTPDCTGRCGGSDGCGGICLDECIAPQICGGGGAPEVCGDPSWGCGPSPTGRGGPMCDVPAGAFMMGCNSAVDAQCQADEDPWHEVTVPVFKIDKYEVTAGEFQEYCAAMHGCSVTTIGPNCTFDVPVRGGHPINCVDWDQARAYCTWAGKRIPTEAEWEKAARGTDERIFPWGDEPLDCEHAVAACGGTSTLPVGSKPLGTSPYGAEDMIGNVYEWVEDWYHESYIDAPADGSAWLTPAGSNRVIRGGSWDSQRYDFLRASYRNYSAPTTGDYRVGFRCVLSVQ